ncbi:MAG TPA: FkbM family methyltransferase [Phycisphaerae bacterium]|nr:FkbM family methyltransferase [Phycisphaerae bacterium]
MFGKIGIILGDAKRLARVCGFGTAARWLWSIVASFGACKREHNLQPADRHMGVGPFQCRRGNAKALLTGEGVISGIREIWCRDVYLNKYLQINDGDTVVDLGCNMGNFSMLALGSGPKVRVVGVEPLQENINKVHRQLEVNGWQDRMQTFRVFVGGKTQLQDELLESPDSGSAPFISEQELIDRSKVSRIDFLKCDIEGSEFDLLTSESKLLAMTQQLAVEVHDVAGDREGFLNRLRGCGFEIWPSRVTAGDGVYCARRQRTLVREPALA